MTVYFDNAATTRVRPEAVTKMTEVMTEQYGNPSSTHFLGRQAKELLETSRHEIASVIGAKPEEIFFTSGGTEADNLAIFGAAGAMRHRGNHIVTTMIEHDAVLRPFEQLQESGWDVSYVRPDEGGRISPDDIIAAMRDDTVLVSVMLVNNETGVQNDISQISDEIEKMNRPVIFHTDAAQALCKLPFKVKELGVDLLSLSGHKIHAPQGVGALYVKSGVKLSPTLFGGSQEGGLRAGTEALPAIAAFGVSAKLGYSEMSDKNEKVKAVREGIVSSLRERIPEAVIIGEDTIPHILSISLPGYKSEVLMNYMEAEGICVSKSSACKKGKRSHVLEAMGLKNEVIDGAIRLSFSGDNTESEAEYFIEKLFEAKTRLYKTLK